jgi:hypothetical protein
VDDNRLDDLGAHLKFQSQCQGLTQLHHDVDGAVADQAVEAVSLGGSIHRPTTPLRS